MIKLIKKLINMTINFFKWLWSECKDWHTLVLLGIVSLVLSFPIWMGYIVGLIFDLPWAIVAATTVWGFWMLPGAPFFALAISITLAIKKIFKKIKERKARKAGNAEEETPEATDIDAQNQK